MHENTVERMNKESLASMPNIQGPQGFQTFIRTSNAVNQSSGGIDMIIQSNNIVNKLNLKALEEQRDENTG